MHSLKQFDGELMIDNRANGERTPGFEKYGTNFSVPSLYCVHCGGHQIPNLARTRPREYCKYCNKYICDGCHAVTAKPDYVHRTIDDLTEMVTSGRYIIAGGTVCDPILIPTGVK
jgi:hypothetical protein